MYRFLKRLLGGIVLIFIVCVITFFLFKALPGSAYADKVYQSLVAGNTRASAEIEWQEYVETHALNKPLFYFSILPSYVDSRASEIPLHTQYKKYVNAAQFYQPRVAFYDFWLRFRHDTLSEKNTSMIISNLSGGLPPLQVMEKIQFANKDNPIDSMLFVGLAALELRNSGIDFPRVIWNGAENQFHYWLAQFFTGKLVSDKLGRPVLMVMWNALIWTLSINIPAFLILFFLGIFLGTTRSLWDNSVVRLMEKVFFVFYSMPLFWLATLALTLTILYLPEGTYQILIGPTRSEELSLLKIYADYFSSIYLPIICIVLHGTIYISRHTEQSIDSVKNSRYVLASRSRNIDEKTILKKHIFPNAIRPIITLIPQLLPGLLAGSIIIELIFNIPGMGRLFWTSLLSRDWQMIFGMVIFISIVVYLSMWLADILYPHKEKIDTYV